MSDSDDTDELLLMTPHIQDHIIEEVQVPYYDIVDKLITQVSKLKNRITSIENSSDISLGSFTNSIETFLNMQSSDSNNTCRRCLSFESLPQHTNCARSTIPLCFSTQSTPQKPRSKLMLKSFPNSPKYEEELRMFKKSNMLSPRSRVIEGEVIEGNLIQKEPIKEESNIIEEIDNFLSNIKPMRPNSARTLDFGYYESLKQQNKITVDVDQILKEMDKQKERIQNLHETQDCSVTMNSPKKINGYKPLTECKKDVETMSVSSNDSSSITDKCTVLFQPAGKRNLSNNVAENRRNLETHPQVKSKAKEEGAKSIPTNNYCKENIIDSSSESSKQSLLSSHSDVNSNARDVLTVHQKLLEETNSPEFSSYHDPTRKLIKSVSDQRLGNVSLVNLWTNEKKDLESNSEKCIQRLQEEKLRRTHCEELIQQLQNKILEQQEKLAVAIQVDEAKDNAILRFHDAWEKASIKFKLVVQERDKLEEDVQKLTNQNKKTVEECEEKIDFHRKETNQVLNTLEDHKLKLDETNKKLDECSRENEMLKSSNNALEEKIAKEEEKNKQLSNILANKEIELNESKSILMHAKKEVAQCQTAVEMCQKDFETMKNEYELLHDENRTEKSNNAQLREQNTALQEELDLQRRKEKSLLGDLKDVQEKLESNKRELRNFYQGQVELLVQNKLKEFQKQLDDAELKMKEQLEKKELEIAKSAAMHIQQISDKYTLEINLIEQRHQEEMQLKQVKIAQLEQKLYETQGKLERQQDRRSDLIKQLQRVMEAQWSEALRIINNGKSPAPLEDSSGTMDQLQNLQSRSYQNMEALLSEDLDDRARNQQYGLRENGGHHHSQQSERKNQHRKENQGQRAKSRGGKHQDGGDLQKYISMLLLKQPGNPVEEKEKNSHKYSTEHPTSGNPAWQRTEPPQYDADSLGNHSHKEVNRRRTSRK